MVQRDSYCILWVVFSAASCAAASSPRDDKLRVSVQQQLAEVTYKTLTMPKCCIMPFTDAAANPQLLARVDGVWYVEGIQWRMFSCQTHASVQQGYAVWPPSISQAAYGMCV